ncbi:MAG: glycerol-3-phosphate O-acyltransferase [Flavobacteriales bacterium]
MPLRKNIKKPLPHVIENMEDWPIYRSYNNNEEFLEKVKDKVLQHLSWLNLGEENTFRKELKNIVYQEKIRLSKTPWKSDDPKEKIFWNEIKRQFKSVKDIDNKGDAEEFDLEILNKILDFYGKEMVANFKPSTFRFAQKALPYIYSRLINSFPQALYKIFSSTDMLYDRMKISGDLDHLRKLENMGTLIVVPTHYSNLDSPTIGLSLNNIGLSGFTYGAGINLFTIKSLSNFMHNIGAYKVDRRRKHKLYLETLKSYSTVALTEGVNSLFYPGGSRSHSGMLEEKLKLGLLGTALDAQRINLQDGNKKKIFIIPVTLNYHYVLEAKKLIENHLKNEGKEDYLEDENATPFGLIKRTYKVITSNPGMTVSFAPALDVFGNKVDEEGESISKIGNKVDIADYFKLNGSIIRDVQRDQQYTQILGERILKEFKENTVVLSSNLVAYVAFQIIRKRFSQFTVFEILSLPKDETTVSEIEFKIVLDRIRDRLKVLEEDKKIRLSSDLDLPTEELMNVGIKKVGSSHPTYVLRKNKNGVISTRSMKLLYYYHNKLSSYGLDEYI